MKRKWFRVAGIALLTSWGITVIAGEVPFDQKTFDDLRAAGKPAVAHFHAAWCPTCKAQQRVLVELLSDPEFKNLTVLSVDFDTERALRSALNVSKQSTFVVFKGNKEVGRSTGDTRGANIAELFRKAL